MAERTAQKQFSLKTDWVTVFASQIVDYGTKAFEKTRSFDISQLKNLFKNFPREKVKALFKNRRLVISLLVVLFLTGAFIIARNKLASVKSPVFDNNSQTNFAPQSSVFLNKKIEIPIRSSSGAATGEKLVVNLTTIDRAKKILIQGKPATARDGKMFIILNLEIDNVTRNQLTVRPVDFIRFVNEGKSFAPDVHNDAVKVEPVSIKRTRVGFVTDESQKDYKFLIGEISGDKQTIEVTI